MRDLLGSTTAFIGVFGLQNKIYTHLCSKGSTSTAPHLFYISYTGYSTHSGSQQPQLMPEQSHLTSVPLGQAPHSSPVTGTPQGRSYEASLNIESIVRIKTSLILVWKLNSLHRNSLQPNLLIWFAVGSFVYWLACSDLVVLDMCV